MFLRVADTEQLRRVANRFSRDKSWELENPGWATETNVHITTFLGVTAIYFTVVLVFFGGYRIRVYYGKSIHYKWYTSGLCLYLSSVISGECGVGMIL